MENTYSFGNKAHVNVKFKKLKLQMNILFGKNYYLNRLIAMSMLMLSHVSQYLVKLLLSKEKCLKYL